MKLYITFGQDHKHNVNGHTFDKDSVAEIECESFTHGRKIAYELFSNKFCTSYLKPEIMQALHHFSRGILKAN